MSIREVFKLAADEGYGFFPAGLLLNNGRYRVIRALGDGQYSSVVLATDLTCVSCSNMHVLGVYIVTLP